MIELIIEEKKEAGRNCYKMKRDRNESCPYPIE
jgi:hypothetical protein